MADVMAEYVSYDNFDPVWLVDKTEYPQKRNTNRYSENEIARCSRYHYENIKDGIACKPYDRDFVEIKRLIEENGFIKAFYGKDLFTNAYDARVGRTNTTQYNTEYETVKHIQSMWDF